MQGVGISIHHGKACFLRCIASGTGRGGGVQIAAVNPCGHSACQVAGTLVADHQTVGGIQTVAVKQDPEKGGIRLAAPLVRGDKDTVEQIPESQRAQLVFGEDPLGIGQEVDPTAFCMELLQCADRGGIAL